MSSDRCYHCQSSILSGVHIEQVIDGQGRFFCCHGCQQVSQLIHHHQLETYYTQRDATPQKVESIDRTQFLDFDIPEIQSEFVTFHPSIDEKTQASTTLSLFNIHCTACAWLIERYINTLKGIVDVQVNLTTARAHLRWQYGDILLSEILYQFAALGYPAKPFDQIEEEQINLKQSKAMLIRLGIAALASMQVMMIAIALYFLPDQSDAFHTYLRYVSLIFATPVLLYAAWPFYLNAYRALQFRQLNMDVPISLALLLAYIASAYATFTQSGEVYFESIAMFVFFLLLGRFLEQKARYQAAAQTSQLMTRMPKKARCKDGTFRLVHQLAPQDIVVVKPGERITADGIIVCGQSDVDQSILTGEPTRFLCAEGDTLYAGSTNGQGYLEIKVERPYTQWQINQIQQIQQQAQQRKSNQLRQADIIARYFVAAVLAIALFAFIFWSYQSDIDSAIWITLAILVATCPCALALAAPTALTCAQSQMQRLGLLVKHQQAVETLSQVDCWLMDKTGTLTQGEMQLESLNILDSRYSEDEVLNLIANLESHSQHPIATAFSQVQRSESQFEQPTIHPSQGISGLLHGQCWRFGHGTWLRQFVTASLNTSQLHLCCDAKLIASVTLCDPLRAGAQTFIHELKQQSRYMQIISGDHISQVEKIAKQLGISRYQGSCTPTQKLEQLQQLSTSYITAMIGDGINDAPVLAGAHLSFAMAAGTELSQQQADIIVLNTDLSAIAHAVQLAKRTQRIMRQNTAWAIGYNLTVLPLAFMGLLAPYIAVIGMSASSLLVLMNSLRLLRAKQLTQPIKAASLCPASLS
ncbi:putative copper-importing P-type ATPase A [Vibrio stylophorae]|uniref:Copper-importing P-type ATPase A n=1 Tax=Vibrio stylophorae TaxID=659351 RepID=A0ABM8ZTJ9_9VIBR|nr:heavy metal translocating P-type ATPase [Vibrio stylophorae]CAH0533492.1 putative copper-importing P-type ATPase A [Vibrio stylophorae]